MIIVRPNGNVDENAAPGADKTGLVNPTFSHQKWMEGSFESSFNDIVNYVDSHYRTVKTKRKRAIAGLSMGGYHSLYISANNPSDYAYVGLFSACTRTTQSSPACSTRTACATPTRSRLAATSGATGASTCWRLCLNCSSDNI